MENTIETLTLKFDSGMTDSRVTQIRNKCEEYTFEKEKIDFIMSNIESLKKNIVKRKISAKMHKYILIIICT